MIDITFDMFFDRLGVIAALDRASVKTLSKFGAFVRTNARRRIRKRKKSSTPGNAPHSHVGLLRERIFFGYDAGSRSVVIGPQLIGSSRRRGNQTVPALLEFGGYTSHWRTGKPAKYAAFPFMNPALEEETDKFAKLFANSVR